MRRLTAFVVSGGALVWLQVGAVGVSAGILPILVSVDHLGFGTVFPGEQLTQQFTVSIAPEHQGQTQDYWIIQKRKPLPPAHPEYPNGGDPQLPGYYRDLCPYLTKTSTESEGDVEAAAQLTAVTDPTDIWDVTLKVPAIANPISGGVSQDHDGGIITTNGEYGCDLSINIDALCGNGIQEVGEECDLGAQNGVPGSQCSASCTTIIDCTQPVDVVVVFDRSGSMNYDAGTRLEDAKDAAKGFVDLLGAQDQAALVSYANTVSLDHQLDANFASLKTKIDAIVAIGGTNIGDAIGAANTELASARHNASSTPMQILLTDGRANRPNGPGFGENAADVAYALSKADAAAAAGTTIYTIGLGTDVNIAMLQDIASRTGGQFFSSPDSGDLAAIYTEIAARLCPQLPRCGDGVVNQTSEQCDDGNSNNEDECRNDCTEPGTGGPEAFCGDGVRQTPNDNGFDELCDDGNQVNGDGCETDCTTSTFCGDGLVQRPNDAGVIEACDQAGANGRVCAPAYGQTCSYCSTACANTSVRGPFCGDGAVNGTETCDDANTIDTDACRNTCTRPQAPAPRCGDGVVNQTSEQCDDGINNGQTNSSCSAQCTLLTSCSQAVDAVLVFDRSGSMRYDNGARLAAAKAASKGFVDLLTPNDRAGLVTYSNDAVLDHQLNDSFSSLKSKIDAVTAGGGTNIGDAIRFANQELDSVRHRATSTPVQILLTDGRANRPNGPGYGENAADVQYALDQAAVAASRGVRIFTIGLGTDVNTTMLQQIATVTGGQYYASPTSDDLEEIYNTIARSLCPVAQCGDGVINQSSEVCDNGLAGNGAACSPAYGGSCDYCSLSCQNISVVGARCGDGIVNGPEACDDANTVDTDACRNNCTSQPLGAAVCGNGALEVGEACDDGPGNDVGCSPGYGGACQYCTGACAPVVLTGGFCGDGIVNGPEACDDANTISTDACTNSCTVGEEGPTGGPDTFCGDSVVQTPNDSGFNEQCDDGNGNDVDACHSNCTVVQTVTTSTGGGSGGGGGGPVSFTPLLAMTKIAQPTQVLPGGSVTFTIEITNSGGVVGEGLTIIDTLPTGWSFADVGGITKTMAVGVIGSLGSKVSVSYTAIAGATIPVGFYSNHATSTVQNAGTTGGWATAQATVEVVAASTIPTDGRVGGTEEEENGTGGPTDDTTGGTGGPGATLGSGGKVLGVGTGPSDDFDGKQSGFLGDELSAGEVAGTSTTVSTSTAPTQLLDDEVLEVTGVGTCGIWLWPLIIINAAIVITLFFVGRVDAHPPIPAAWVIGAILFLLPTILLYPQCVLEQWLVATGLVNGGYLVARLVGRSRAV